jgi:NitT/TauT family transport system ATP-binding protein
MTSESIQSSHVRRGRVGLGHTTQGAITVENVSKTYDSGKGAVRALAETSVAVDAGSFVSVVGPSGGGKTTLLKIIGDIITATSGHVTIDGIPAGALRRRREIGYVFQTPVLLPWRTVEDNVTLPFDLGRGRLHAGRGRRQKAEAKKLARDALDMVGLTDFADRLPAELSGGMQARVSLARALVYSPKVLLMDEPFAALDELTRTEMASHLLRVWETLHTTVLFVTHHIEEAVLLSNRVIVMSDRPGRVRRQVQVDLPRPRSLASRRLPRFREIVEDLVEDFHGHYGRG